jgi:hypothetical protein
MASVEISDSVGRRGKNRSDDVKKIQAALAIVLPGRRIAVDGEATRDLEQAIVAFQSIYSSRLDGRVDKDGRALRRINVLIEKGLTRQHAVPLLSQVSVKKCWEASARMMWAWRKGGLVGYAQAAGKAATEDRGRSEDEMQAFNTSLGMQSKPRPKGLDLLRLLAAGPVLFTGIRKIWGHASVATGYDHARGIYKVNNPAGVTSYDFDDESKDKATGTAVDVSMKDVEKSLGRFVWHW